MQARHEFKHSLNYGDYVILRDRLRKVMRHDEHADESGEYRVRSLYFDTLGDKALREKIDGVDDREKFRIRRYPGGSDTIVLEKKAKKRGLCYKYSTPLTKAETKKILSGDLKWMMHDSRQLVRELYLKMKAEQLKPKTVVDYLREPFVASAGNVRITFDRKIQTGLYSTDFLNDQLPTLDAGEELVLLEVKYDQFIPSYVLEVLQLGNRQSTSCSKYALCRIYG
ncbi:MAG: polyphosphate polymerase domain-containing protein [Erysipelotrichaceae bacterium]|jgi:hypothetical protein|nr:polyphosphate polymerase domain-containing protein [Erysipelotrichaceae bacterium]